MSKKIVVTGGSGAAASYVIKELIEHGYEVKNLDINPPREELCPFEKVNLSDYDSVRLALEGFDAVIAYASNPEPDFDFSTGADRFANNTLCTYNVINAACDLKMDKVVWASSETTMGFPFDDNRPVSVPVDETDEPQPQNSYAISKVLCEELAKYMNRLHGVPIIGLRLSNVLYTDNNHPDTYLKVPGYWSDPLSRKFNLWSYIDARDAARCTRLALESDIHGSENFIVAARDTIMSQQNKELMDTVFPGVPIKAGTGDYESLISSNKARDLLGWRPRYSWRDIVSS